MMLVILLEGRMGLKAKSLKPSQNQPDVDSFNPNGVGL